MPSAFNLSHSLIKGQISLLGYNVLFSREIALETKCYKIFKLVKSRDILSYSIKNYGM